MMAPFFPYRLPIIADWQRRHKNLTFVRHFKDSIIEQLLMES